MNLNTRTPYALILLFALVIELGTCLTQQQLQQQLQQHDQSVSTPTVTSGANANNNNSNYPRSSMARFQRPHTATASAFKSTTTTINGNNNNCEFKDVMNNMHDRISVLATLNEAERSHLDTIDNKITQFESGNLARLESLKAQQMHFLKQLESIELMQRTMKIELSSLKGESDQMQMLKAIADDVENEMNNTTRVIRQAGGVSGTVPPNVGIAQLNETLKLDAIFQLITANGISVRELAKGTHDYLSRISQTTTNIQRRVNNLQRRVQALTNAGVGGVYLPPAARSGAPNLITSCASDAPAINGLLQLQLTPTSEPFYVLCDDKPGDQQLGTGWTVIMNRFNGDVNFQRDWAEYKTGFGNVAGEFFIGLDKLHALTASAVHELVIVLEDFDGERRFARYNLFAIGNEQSAYALNVLGAYSGTAGDALTYHAGFKFSTFDNDNDGCEDCNCAQGHMGAWWYNWCDQSNLFGKYFNKDDVIPTYQGMYWHLFRGPKYSLRAAKMLIRPIALADYESRR